MLCGTCRRIAQDQLLCMLFGRFRRRTYCAKQNHGSGSVFFSETLECSNDMKFDAGLSAQGTGSDNSLRTAEGISESYFCHRRTPLT
jgi:hypothetical protein